MPARFSFLCTVPVGIPVGFPVEGEDVRHGAILTSAGDVGAVVTLRAERLWTTPLAAAGLVGGDL
ncbi:hypothetical protein JCM33774_54100 [Actinophytocola sp. KF-1]